MTKGPVLTHLLLGLCGLLALVNGAEWAYLSHGVNQSRQFLEQPVESDIVVDPVGRHDFVLPPKERFSDIVERPLLIQGRHPVPEEAEEPIITGPVNQGEIQIWLMGVVMTPNGMTALLLDGKGDYKHLQIDEKIEGWELDEMHADRVVLNQGGATRTLNLRDPNKPVPKSPPPVIQNKPLQPKPAVPRKQGQQPAVPRIPAQPPLQTPGIPNQSVSQ
ncbi:MAG: hypothetical protein ACRERU_16130 [Methylococcales bacterium]